MCAKNLNDSGVNPVSLVVFTCEGREHLLRRSFVSFINSCDYKFEKVILAVDGQIDPFVISQINPDLIIQRNQRGGYVESISKALKVIDTPFFFWLEDDWEFPYAVSINDLIPLLAKKNVLQLTLAKESLNSDFKPYTIPGIYINGYGFSANPSLCSTSVVKDIFHEIATYKKDENSKFLSFEYFATDYSTDKNLVSLIKYHDNLAYVNHLGDLESTAREYHMINSISIPLNPLNKEYISGLNRDYTPGLYNKLGMFFKIYIAMFYLSIKLFFERESYDFAFRIYLAFLKRFKH
jgi:hypothetical protein